MQENRFHFKSFEVIQNDQVHKVGTDGVLVGAWATVGDSDQRILDIGTGTGLIALMMAQRSKATIEAIESDELAIVIAQKNFQNSPWGDRIRLHHTRLQEFQTESGFDRIISNPPFFHNKLAPPDEKRKTQRHTSSLSFEMLALHCSRLLNKSGSVSIILPVEESIKVKVEFEKHHLFLSRLTEVYSKPRQSPMRHLQEYRFGNDSVSKSHLTLTTTSGERSAEYSSLTASFYL